MLSIVSEGWELFTKRCLCGPSLILWRNPLCKSKRVQQVRGEWRPSSRWPVASKHPSPNDLRHPMGNFSTPRGAYFTALCLVRLTHIDSFITAWNGLCVRYRPNGTDHHRTAKKHQSFSKNKWTLSLKRGNRFLEKKRKKEALNIHFVGIN